MTTALRDQNLELRALPGWCAILARVTSIEKRSYKRPGSRQLPAESTIAGIVSGEFDRIIEANDAFLNMLGYSREEFIRQRIAVGGYRGAGILASAGTRP